MVTLLAATSVNRGVIRLISIQHVTIMTRFLHIGGLIAIGFDPTGQYMLTLSHSGRGVFHLGDWERVARDLELAYPESGHAIGIGPIAGVRIPITEMDYDTGCISATTPDKKHHIEYSQGTVTIETNFAHPTLDPNVG